MNLKTFLALFLILFFVACDPGKKDDSPSEPPTTSEPSPTPAPTDPPNSPPTGPGGEPPISEPPVVTNPSPEPAPSPSPELPPDPAETFKINITFGGDAKYNTESRREKYRKAIVLMKKVVATKEFRDRIFAHEYGSNDFAHMSTDPCKTDDCLYQHILDGNEKLSNTKDNEMDMEVRFYYSSSNTVGYTYAGVKYIYVNVRYFDSYALSSVCANMMHEWLHKLGYGHDSASTARRPYSIPYAVGGITKSVGSKL